MGRPSGSGRARGRGLDVEEGGEGVTRGQRRGRGVVRRPTNRPKPVSISPKRMKFRKPNINALAPSQSRSDAGDPGPSTSRIPPEPTPVIPSTSYAPPSPAAPTPAAFVDNGSPSTLVPSPAAFVEYGSRSMAGRRPSLPRRNLADEILNYGSDVDSDDGDDDVLPSVHVHSRVDQALQDTPLDLEEQERQESPVAMGMEPYLYLLDEPYLHLLDESASPAELDTMEPRDLFQFDWKEFPEVPVDPTLRRERFTPLNVGPTIDISDPYGIFTSIWDKDIMSIIAEETNLYAQQRMETMIERGVLKPESRLCRWKDTDVDELYVYFALTLAMGSVVKNSVEDYWSHSKGVLATPGFAAYMSYNRYFLITTCLHFMNNKNMNTFELSYSEAKLFKIKPILNHLNHKFQYYYSLGQNISLDESLLMWKGPLEINQLISNKAAHIGIKSYEVCESETGYLWRFEIHAHKKASVQQQGDILTSSTPSIVLRLVKGLEYRGHCLWMDNFYNSPALARRLKSLGFDCVGTLRTNRMFVPKSLNSLTKDLMGPANITGLTSGDVDVMVWRDSNRVGIISTYHGNAVVRDLQSTKPIAIYDYNIAMGGVDKKDQMLSYYPVERKKGSVWYKKLFKRLLNVSVHNTYIIHKHNSQEAPLSVKTLRENLINALLQKHSPRPVFIVPQSPRKPMPTQNVADVTHRLTISPYSEGRRPRRLCVVCKKRMSTFCVGCDQALCLEGECFEIAHTVRDIIE